jgi:biopolymer transport protein ExbB
MDKMSLWELLAEVGWTMVPIYLCSVFVVMLTVRKLLDFRAARLPDIKWLEPVIGNLEEAEIEAAQRAAAGTRHPAGGVASAFIRAMEDKPEQADAEAQRAGLEAIAKLERNMRPLALCAEIAPLLGLLGTVIGMVELFQGIQGQQTGNMAMDALSGGIWKALLTTAAGLTVAVPALAVHAYLTSRVERFRVQLSTVVQRLRYAYPTVTR